MKKVAFLLMLFCIAIVSKAQIPQGFNYQAVAHNSAGAPIMNTTIQVKAGILSDTLIPVIVWEELHSTVKTNAFGVFNLVIGTGTRQSGSTLSFNDVDWTKTPLYLKIQIYYQNVWKYMGTSKLWSVPYSIVSGNTLNATGLQTEIDAIETGAGLNDNGSYSANTSASYITMASSLKDADNKLDAQVKKNSDNIAANPTKMLIKGSETSPDSALFRVVNKNGQTVFAVYNEGVRIYVDDGAKGAKGGFSIGGFGSEKSPSQNLFVVNPDSIRAYIDTNTGKGAKGGFSIGGFGTNKVPGEEYLRVTRDSTRIYLNNTEPKAAKGGFSIGGFGNSKGLASDYMLINPDSTRFYVRTLSSGASSTFNIIGIDQNQVPMSLLSANTDTVKVSGVMNLQNNLVVNGNIDVTGTINIISDIDGNTYKTILIGTQVWMKENLKTTKYNDGTSIPLVTDSAAWSVLTTPAYCWYNNDAATYKATYGALYNWYTVNTGKLCPTGWHVPTDAEWTTLTTYLGGESVAGGKLKETGLTHWLSPNTGATNETGFTALPGGSRPNYGAYYDVVCYGGGWWSSSEKSTGISWTRGMGYDYSSVGRGYYNLQDGWSVRCVKDN